MLLGHDPVDVIRENEWPWLDGYLMRDGSLKAEQRCLNLVKGRHRYVFQYATGHEPEVLASIVELADDPASGLDWFDAAVLSFQMGKHGGQTAALAGFVE